MAHTKNTSYASQINTIYEKIAANILYASTKCLGEKVYGNMLLGLPEEEATVQRAIKYLTKGGNVLVTEVTGNAG